MCLECLQSFSTEKQSYRAARRKYTFDVIGDMSSEHRTHDDCDKKTPEGRLFNLMYPILHQKCTSERHKRSGKQALKDAVRLFRRHRGEATPSTSRVLFEAGGGRITICQVATSEARAIRDKEFKSLTPQPAS